MNNPADARISILWSFDDNYAGPFAAMATSVREHADAACRLEMILIEDFLGAATRARLERFAARLPGTELRWLRVGTAPIADAPLSLHFTLAAFARMLAFEALEDRTRLLYLDCDMVCLADIREAWHEPLDGQVFGAVIDPGATFCFDGHTEALGMPSRSIHFNSGMMLVDLREWRRQDLTARCLRFLRERRDAVRWADQDVLNGVVRQWRKLPSHWNAQTHFYKRAFIPDIRNYFPEDLAQVQQPKIVHFNDPFKPWHEGYEHPFLQEYHRFFERSGWQALA